VNPRRVDAEIVDSDTGNTIMARTDIHLDETLRRKF
jgi:hypothetical protein